MPLDPAARALVIAGRGRARDVSDRERIERENVDLLRWRQTYIDTFGARPTYMIEFATGRRWGKTCEQRVREAGGIGVAVPASVGVKPKARKRDPRA